MAPEQLSSYIRQQRAAGVPRDDISRAVLAAGWLPSDINEAFAAVEPIGIPVQAPPPVPIPQVPATMQNGSPSAPSTLPGQAASGFGAWFTRFAPALAVVGGLVIVVSGGVAYAYVQQIGPFSVKQYAEGSFLSDVLAKSSQIQSASYVLSASLAVDPREPDAVAFTVPAPDPSLVAQYQDDSKKLSAISSVLSELKYTYGEQRSYNYQTRKYVVTAAKPYPASFVPTTAGVSSSDYQYAAADGGKNFALTATFETSAAISAIRGSYGYTATTTIIDGNKVTFTKDSVGYFFLPSTPPQPFLASLADSLRSLSPDVSGNVSVGATTDFSKDGFPDWRFDAAANGSFGDLSYQVDVEALKKDANYYIRINKMPSLPFIPFANYKGQWIEITPQAASSSAATPGQYNEFSYLAANISGTEADYKKNRADLAAALMNLARLADKDNLTSFKTNPVRETVDGRDLYRYQLTISKDAIIPFYKDVLADPSTYQKLGVTQDQGLLDYLQSKEFDDIFAYMESNTYLTLWTDRDGFPAILEYRLRVVPPDTAVQLKDKQVDISLKLTFSDINKSVTIETPTDAKPVETVIQEMNNNVSDALGTARMKGNDAAVQSDLATIQTQAEIYYGTNNNSYGTQAWKSGPATACTGGMFKNSVVTTALTGADAANGVGKNVACYATGSSYLVGADLASGGWWCVDSTGSARAETGSMPNTLPAGKKCP